jgi:enoyl-CoA hydratase
MGDSTNATPLSLVINGNIGRLVLNDGRKNLIGKKMLEALEKSFSELREADAAILTGRSHIFSAGLDIAEINCLNKNELLDFFDYLHNIRCKLFSLPRPLITVTAGSAIGAGASLVCCGDVRLSAQDSGKVGFTEARFGLPMPASSHVIATSALTTPEGQLTLLMGSKCGKTEAKKLGYFHKLTDPKKLHKIAGNYAVALSKNTKSSALIKHSLRRKALEEMESNKTKSHKLIVEMWFLDETQKIIKNVIQSMKSRKHLFKNFTGCPQHIGSVDGSR